MLRYRGKSLSLETHPEKFQHEIYRSDAGDSEDAWEFAGLVSQKLSVRKHEEPTAVVDRALEVFQSRMANIKREREAQTYVLVSSFALTGQFGFVPNSNAQHCSDNTRRSNNST